MFRIAEGHTLFEEDLSHISDQVGDAWKHLDGAHIFVTGGTGFFGLWLVEGLLWAIEQRGLRAEITVLSRAPERFLSGAGRHLVNRAALHFLRGSATDFAVDTGPFSHIVHAASETNIGGTDDWAARHLKTAIDGTQRMIDLAVSHKSEALLLTTSGAVYKHQDQIEENRCIEGFQSVADFTSENTLYAQSKRMMEAMTAVGAQNGAYRALVARCFAFVGPYLALDSNYAIGNFMRDAMKGGQIVIGGDGTPLRSYLYAADLVIWLLTILAKGQSGRPYNVGGERAYSIAELAHEVSDCVGTGEVVVRQTPDSTRPVNAYLPDITRAKQELGLEVYTDLRDAITRTVAWHRARN